ncbi:uncharacterized protein EV420DRAFT_1551462 [Desarmillaria tabescens]|uniref:Uncharacterized protein n=1 Tax=Armillaria tabescens TaxID=1929756 RepID=A0AA39KE32_ARMTA|nr:uncharacterized protein EV420DRAFT_1551462 [Desarmillaria tabescens]KAK0457108.1 hypothetical protein EV420DRAFT_1551462 [Desarmillaria tabescens]
MPYPGKPAKELQTIGSEETSSLPSISPLTPPTTRSSTHPEAPSLHLHAAYVYLARNFRRLLFFALLGGLCAFSVISQVCAPYSSMYCTSVTRWRPFSPSYTSRDTHSSCIDRGDCLGSVIAARTIHSHLMHAHYIVNLIEGTGLPPMHFFNSTPVRRNFADRGLSFYVNDDPERRPLIEDLPKFFHLRRLIHDQYHPYLIENFYAYFGTKSTRPIHRAFRAAITGLSKAIERETKLSRATQQRRVVEVDEILRKALNRLFKELQNIFRQLAVDTSPFLNYISTVHAQSQRISSELESEVPRVEEAFRQIPWWDSHPFVGLFAHGILGIKPQRRMFTKYHEFLSMDASNIRYFVEQVAILHDHLEILQRYFLWYSNGPTLVNDAKDTPVPTPAELLKLEDELVEQLHAAQWDTRYAPIPPRRLTAMYPSLPFSPDHLSSPSQ